MKKTFTIVLMTLLAVRWTHAQTQLSNGGFENWTTDPEYSVETPDDWQDGIMCVSLGETEQCTFTVEQTTDAHSGSYALKHLNEDDGGGGVNYQTFSNMFLDDEFNLSGTPFTGKPSSVSFYYKYSTDDEQPMTVSFMLYTGSLNDLDFVATGEYSFSSSVSTYTKADVNLTYFSTDAPSGILITADYDEDPATANDVLILDDIVFEYSVTDINESLLAKQLNAHVLNKHLHTSLPVSQVLISDMTGKSVASFSGEGTQFPLQQLKTGVYILSGMVNDQPVSTRLLVD